MFILIVYNLVNTLDAIELLYREFLMVQQSLLMLLILIIMIIEQSILRGAFYFKRRILLQPLQSLDMTDLIIRTHTQTCTV